jgi:hypothetical protein
LIRYRKKSLKTTLGVTKAKRQVKKNLGIYEVTKYTNAGKNTKRRVKRKLGYESEPAKLGRFLRRLFKR